MNNNNAINQPLLPEHDLENQNHGEQTLEEMEQYSLDIDACIPSMTTINFGVCFIIAGIMDACSNNQFDYPDSFAISTGVFLSALGIHALWQRDNCVSKLMRKVMFGSLFCIGWSVKNMVTEEKINFSLLPKVI